MTPRNSEQNEVIRQERQKQILNAALTVYVHMGYAASEIADVSIEAGLARGLVYYYFKNKQVLFRSLFIWMHEQSRNYTKQILIDGDGSPSQRLLHYAQKMCEGSLRDARFPQFYMRAYQDANLVFDDKDQGFIQSKYVLRDYMATVIRQGMDAGELRLGDPILAANAYWGALSMNLAELLNRKERNVSDSGVEATASVEEIVTYCLYGLMLRGHCEGGEPNYG